MIDLEASRREIKVVGKVMEEVRERERKEWDMAGCQWAAASFDTVSFFQGSFDCASILPFLHIHCWYGVHSVDLLPFAIAPTCPNPSLRHAYVVEPASHRCSATGHDCSPSPHPSTRVNPQKHPECVVQKQTLRSSWFRPETTHSLHHVKVGSHRKPGA